MKRLLLTMVATAMSLCGFTATATAQSNLHVKATVPFSFVTEHSEFSQGEYEIREVRPSVIALQNTANDDTTLMPAIPELRGGKSRGPALVFHRYGNQYFLVQVISNNGDTVQNLITTTAEKKLIKQQKIPKLTVIRVSNDGKSGD